MSYSESPPNHSDLPPLALAGAAGAALLGALAWAAFSYVTGRELGYVAWGVGLLVGFATVRLGGRGAFLGTLAAGLTLVAIFSGKLLSTHLLVEKELAAFADQALTRASYQEMLDDAAEWAELVQPDEEDVRFFMAERGYAGTDDPAGVTSADLAEFHAFSVPVLERLTAERPAFDAWRERAIADTRMAFEAENSLLGLVVQDLNPIDLIFAILAVTTAFGMVSRATSAIPAVDPESRDADFRRAA